MKCWVCSTDLDSEIPVDLMFFFLPDCCQDLLPEVFVKLMLTVQLHCQPVLQAHTLLMKSGFCVAWQELPKFSSLFSCFYMVYSSAENQVFTIPICFVTFNNEICRKIFCRNMLKYVIT